MIFFNSILNKFTFTSTAICKRYIKKTFLDSVFLSSLLKSTNKFCFRSVTRCEIFKLLKKIDKLSAPGHTGIESSILSHELLLFKLRLYNFSESSKNLYLTNRAVFTKFGSLLSAKVKLTVSVPRGSVLGPLLFIIFINESFMNN